MKAIKIGDYVKFISSEISLDLGMMKVGHIDYVHRKCICYCKGGYWLFLYKKFFKVDPKLIVLYEIHLDSLELDHSITGNPIDVKNRFGEDIYMPNGELCKIFLTRVYRNNMLCYHSSSESLTA